MDTKISSMQPTFLFDDRKRFDAEREHDRLRSSLNLDIEIPPTADPWKQRPVDFTLKNFHPQRRKEKHSSSTDDLLSLDTSSILSRIDTTDAMKPFTEQYYSQVRKNATDADEFQVDPRIKYDKVKRMLNTEPYKNPKLHDFRQYPDIKSLGLSEFETNYERDPYNIQFLTNNLNTIWLQEHEHERVPIVKQPIPEMYRALTAKPKWDSKLILPKLVFPNKYAAYTRYRNPTRTVKSAYWERVEDYFGHRHKKRLNVN